MLASVLCAQKQNPGPKACVAATPRKKVGEASGLLEGVIIRSPCRNPNGPSTCWACLDPAWDGDRLWDPVAAGPEKERFNLFKSKLSHHRSSCLLASWSIIISDFPCLGENVCSFLIGRCFGSRRAVFEGPRFEFPNLFRHVSTHSILSDKANISRIYALRNYAMTKRYGGGAVRVPTWIY